MTKHMDHLKQLKDFDENISREKQAKAKEEQDKMRAQVSSWKECIKKIKIRNTRNSAARLISTNQ